MQLFETIVALAVSYRVAQGQDASCENRAFIEHKPACCVGADNGTDNQKVKNCLQGCTGAVDHEQQNDPSFETVPSSRPCFCDDRCAQLGDCCHDFADTCKYPKSCATMSAWSNWSKCKLPSEKSCGKGVIIRTRQPKNDDVRCFSSGRKEQKRTCRKRCPLHKSSAASIFPAPATFRKQLEIESGDYCHLYKITRRSSSCTAQKRVYKNICVACRADIAPSSGCSGSVEASRGSWTIENFNGLPYCHGRWINFYKKVDCSVCMKKGASFLYM